MEAGSRIKSIMTNRLDPGGLQVKRYISRSYTSQVNQALSRWTTLIRKAFYSSNFKP